MLVYRNGDISFQSLVDLDNIHEIADFSPGPRDGHVHSASLVTDNYGRPLLALCMYGSTQRYSHAHDFGHPLINPRLFFVTLEAEARSISLVRRLEVDLPVIAVAIQHDTIVCVCQYMGEDTFCFVITTLDDTVKRVLSISRISAGSAVRTRYAVRITCSSQPCRPSITATFVYPLRQPSSSSKQPTSGATISQTCQNYPPVTTVSPSSHPFGLGKASPLQRLAYQPARCVGNQVAQHPPLLRSSATSSVTQLPSIRRKSR